MLMSRPALYCLFIAFMQEDTESLVVMVPGILMQLQGLILALLLHGGIHISSRVISPQSIVDALSDHLQLAKGRGRNEGPQDSDDI